MLILWNRLKVAGCMYENRQSQPDSGREEAEASEEKEGEKEMKREYTINPVVEEIDYKYVRSFNPFRIYSEVLKGWIIFPIGFVCDRESVPYVKGTSIRAGFSHDLLCRKDAMLYIFFDDPKTAVKQITKKLAADVYLEIMEKRYALVCKGVTGVKKYLKKTDAWTRRYVKYWAVRFAWGYFHKFKVKATYEEITG